MFADAGYDKTSVRDIAAGAGVDPALIRHYFGTKAELFRATMGWPFEPAEVAAQVTGGRKDEIGVRLTQVFFDAWERPESRAPCRRFCAARRPTRSRPLWCGSSFGGQLYRQMADELSGPAAELRIDLAMAQLLGIAYLRHILRVEPIASTPAEELVARVAPVITAYLTGD